MKTYKDFITIDISPYDDWDSNSANTNAITEAGLARVLRKVKGDKKDFIIITAYRGNYDKKENINRNRQLRGWFDRNKMGVYQLVGHWRECSLDNVDYDSCPPDKLVDVVERSYLAIRPDDMSPSDFLGKAKYLTSIWNQDGAVIRIGELFGDEVRIVERTGSTFPIGKSLEVGKIAQAYSQHVKKLNTPFVFEGVEVPATIIGKKIAKQRGFNYPVGNFDDLRSWEDVEGR